MKLNDARKLMAAITQLQSTEVMRKPKFAYFLAKNKRILDQVEKDFSEVLKDDEAQKILEKWEVDRLALVQKISLKDDAGQPVIANNAYQFLDEAEAISQIRQLMLTKHPQVQKVVDEQNAKLQELNEKDDDIPLFYLSISEWPDLPASLTPESLDALCLLMKE